MFNVKGCLLVRQSFFDNNLRNFTNVGGGVLGCRGFHSSFRTSHVRLSLNIGGKKKKERKNKNTFAIIQDMLICHGGTITNMCSNSIIQVEYGVNIANITNNFTIGDRERVLVPITIHIMHTKLLLIFTGVLTLLRRL
ncbi:argonaute 4 [Olea europaea subsp. europaea]|uniref:Argonaute 4 n=1 Tax=Olea europaea subsp. europaea TaxID=158383 RepID=A0A8S0TQ54_OLEEU|nr:argonaute 4 [Olea europaea subsp. europaea]